MPHNRTHATAGRHESLGLRAGGGRTPFRGKGPEAMAAAFGRSCGLTPRANTLSFASPPALEFGDSLHSRAVAAPSQFYAETYACGERGLAGYGGGSAAALAQAPRPPLSVLVPDGSDGDDDDDAVARHHRRCLQQQVEADDQLHALREQGLHAAKTHVGLLRQQPRARSPRPPSVSVPRLSRGLKQATLLDALPPGLRRGDYDASRKRSSVSSGRRSRNASVMTENYRIFDALGKAFEGLGPAQISRVRHFLSRETALRQSMEEDEASGRVKAGRKLSQTITMLQVFETSAPRLVEEEDMYRDQISIDQDKRFARIQRVLRHEFVLLLDTVRKVQIEDAWESIYQAIQPGVRTLSGLETKQRSDVVTSETREANILQVRLNKLAALLLEWPDPGSRVDTPVLSEMYEVCEWGLLCSTLSSCYHRPPPHTPRLCSSNIQRRCSGQDIRGTIPRV